MAKSTKNEIVGALRELLQAKRLDDITVTELVERCGISRQAFYYHFSDLYSVVDYAIQQLLDELGVAGPEDWRSSLEQVLTLLRGNRTLVLNVIVYRIELFFRGVILSLEKFVRWINFDYFRKNFKNN